MRPDTSFNEYVTAPLWSLHDLARPVDARHWPTGCLESLAGDTVTAMRQTIDIGVRRDRPESAICSKPASGAVEVLVSLRCLLSGEQSMYMT